MCTHWCFIRVDFSEKLLSHWLHRNVFYLVSTLWCFVRVNHSEKLLSHWSHGNGFSPVCTRMFCKSNLSEKTLVTLITWKWLLPSVYSLVLYKSRFFRKTVSHWSHENGFSPVCTPQSFKGVVFNLVSMGPLIYHDYKTFVLWWNYAYDS